ncbi:hypothetical protein IPG41_01045 [Candidatus Peregrinibacteria bacterium]|nr:MAG: hypothetical protein IPG41_01045 [Candidatus Peregrinibacteria bacterium]
MAMDLSAPKNENLELGEIEKPRDLYEKAMDLAYEKMDLQAEYAGLLDGGFSEDNEQVQKVEVEIALIDRQIDSLATQWAEGKVSNRVNQKRSARVETRKNHFLSRLERKMRRNERQMDREEVDEEKTGEKVDRRMDRWERRMDRKKSRQEARDIKHGGRTRASERKQARWEARGDRRSAKWERRMDKRTDRLERQVEKTDKELVFKLREAGLRPTHLGMEGPERDRALALAFADDPETLAYYREVLAEGPESPEYEEVMAELQERQGELQTSERYRETLDKTDVALKQLERASLQDNLWGKFGDLIGDFGRNPGAMAAMAGVLAGVYFFRDKIFTKEVGYVVGGLALLGSGVYTADFLMEKLDKEHRGIFDRLGWKPSDALAPNVLESYRKEHFPYLPEKDRDSADEMMRIFNVPMSRVNDVFGQAVNEHETSIDTRKFLGEQADDRKDAVDTKSESHMDGTDLYRGLRSFYMECAERSLGERGLSKLSEDQKIRAGIAYSKAHFIGKSFAEASTILRLDSRIPSHKSEQVAGAPMSRAESFDRHLAFPQNASLKVWAENPAALNTLRALPTGEVLVKGYPYKYNFSDQKNTCSPMF